jgi:ribulose-phosphate 3-epimerase
MGSTRIFSRIREILPTVSVGVTSADLMSLEKEISLIEQAGITLLHFDVMDGCFCPASTIGASFVKGIKTKLFKDVHLMVNDPIDKLGWFASAGADIITVHFESCPTHIHRALQYLSGVSNANDSSRGVMRGIALNPGTPVEVVQPVLEEVEVVTLLAINPGWTGQKFIPSTRDRIQKAISLISQSGKDILLCVDGGITKENAAEVARMGADIVVSGSAIFDGKDPQGNVKFILNSLRTN